MQWWSRAHWASSSARRARCWRWSAWRTTRAVRTAAVELAGAKLAENDRVDIFHVHMADPAAVLSNRFDRIAAADRVVADVEAQPHQRGVG